MSGHTPGPWKLVTGNSAREFNEISIRPTVNPFPEGGFLPFPIASVRYPTYEFGIANARLIAAAPDLLEAAIEFVRKVDCGEGRSTKSYAQFKAAIAKATGGES